MDEHGKAAFLDGVMVLCAAMALVNLGKLKSRGNSAYYLAGAFLALGATVYAYTAHAPDLVLSIGAFVVILLLVADFLYRTGKGK